MLQLDGVLAIVAPDANHLRRFHGRQQTHFAEGQIAAFGALKLRPGTRSCRHGASDGIDAAHLLDKPVAGDILVLKSAVGHATSMNSYLSGTVSVASAERWLSLLRRSTAETE